MLLLVLAGWSGVGQCEPAPPARGGASGLGAERNVAVVRSQARFGSVWTRRSPRESINRHCPSVSARGGQGSLGKRNNCGYTEASRGSSKRGCCQRQGAAHHGFQTRLGAVGHSALHAAREA